jgi:hypothetical protein
MDLRDVASAFNMLPEGDPGSEVLFRKLFFGAVDAETSAKIFESVPLSQMPTILKAKLARLNHMIRDTMLHILNEPTPTNEKEIYEQAVLIMSLYTPEDAGVIRDMFKPETLANIFVMDPTERQTVFVLKALSTLGSVDASILQHSMSPTTAAIIHNYFLQNATPDLLRAIRASAVRNGDPRMVTLIDDSYWLCVCNAPMDGTPFCAGCDLPRSLKSM